MDLQTARARLTVLESDETLDYEENLRGRISALIFVSEVADYALWRPAGEGWPSLLPRAEALRLRLGSSNERLYHTLREHIRAGSYSRADLRRQFDAYTDYSPTRKGSVLSVPDPLDVLLDGLLEITAPVAPRDPLPPDMIRYEPVPARAMLDLVDHTGWGPHDVFFDVGSGLGRAVILFHLLTGRPAKGIEIDPTLCEHARHAAESLNLTQVEFIQGDARAMDYSEGTWFFLFTPFKGTVWRTVLDKLHDESRQRKLKLCTLGPCTLEAAQEPWLTGLDDTRHPYKLARFESR